MADPSTHETIECTMCKGTGEREGKECGTCKGTGVVVVPKPSK